MTRIVKVDVSQHLGWFESGGERLGIWLVSTTPAAQEAVAALTEAARALGEKDVPVGFPTETVYGLAADATRSGAVIGIYKAKKRPSDNPLIIHICDLAMLREYLRPAQQEGEANGTDNTDPIPEIYKPLIERFWPGPLTILMPNPQPSKLAPEVTAGLGSFGVRMPSTPLALSLIKLTGRPLAAPSANASTRPSPTAAQHVFDDLEGRIDLILDGGPCGVGVESTVVDGLCNPPVVLRPGGVSLEELREVPGWEGTVKGYQDASQEGDTYAPRAPGMKYKHYSPKAAVVLCEATYSLAKNNISGNDIRMALADCLPKQKVLMGVIRTRRWRNVGGLAEGMRVVRVDTAEANGALFDVSEVEWEAELDGQTATMLDIDLGEDIRGIAQGLFSALRELDRRGVDVIFVDGVGDGDDIAAAVMNRLRKAASVIPK
ncbi:yrdC protein [Plectosphaerella plurivora]|uniref:Threonylcarbamoyl-AMP synthase n=1 Tax=Plectosphaerella plurivora TaxID=936078 RepID=A0A9P8VF49_9PEZI|nr:yrdC protein [Plectosphaerella plurivora]